MRIRLKQVPGLLKAAGLGWVEDRVPAMGAALAYYTVFAISPVLILAIALAGAILGPEAVQGEILGQVQGLVGKQGGEAIQSMLVAANQSKYSATGVGIVLLLVSAAALFGQLQESMNAIWGVQPKPGRGIRGMVKDRLLSFTMVLGTAFLLLVSLVVSTGLSAAVSLVGATDVAAIGHLLNGLVSLVVFVPLFAMIYRYLPDAQIDWNDVWLGAIVTTLLFLLGKTAIGVYIGHSAVGTTFGAASSLVVLLIWAYYASQIFLFGAELTKVYANRHGSRIRPEPGAELVEDALRRKLEEGEATDASERPAPSTDDYARGGANERDGADAPRSSSTSSGLTGFTR